MGDFPSHNCTSIYDGEEIPIISPMSQLDCERPRCKVKAREARLAAEMYDLDKIDYQIHEAQRSIERGMTTRSLWELYREAKLRTEKP